VGISEFIGDKEYGFSSILKMRYHDFLVNEIDLSGKVVHLEKMGLLDVGDKEQQSKHISNEINKDALTCFSSEEQDALIKLNSSTENAPCVMVKVGDDKQKRTEIHDAVRKHFSSLESSTVDNESGKFIKISKGSGKGRNRKRRQKNALHKFCLYKENIPTMKAVNILSKILKLHGKNSFNYAGNKDKRAITVQEMTTSLSPDRLIYLNKSGRLHNMYIGNITPCTKHLKLGDLNGNHFKIVLRDIKGCDEGKIQESCQSFAEKGFINYFGMQRFGTGTASTCSIGKAILQYEWKTAVDLILSSCANDLDEESQELLKNWDVEGNAEKLLERNRLLQLGPEGYLLYGISRQGTKQLVQALNGIPRNTRMLYVHSYQSYVWNKAVSKRISTYNLKPVEGDLVLVKDESTAESQDEPESKKIRTDDFDSLEEQDDLSVYTKVKRLNADELSNYTIYDVVMPLPGSRVQYPLYDGDNWLQQMLKEDNISLEQLDHRVKEYSLCGAYRKMVVRPQSFKWEIMRYKDYTLPLQLSDKEIMEEKPVPESIPDAPFQALRLEFSLPTSSYASVAVRELSKRDMSVTGLTELTEKHKAASAAVLVTEESAAAEKKEDS